MTIFEYIKRETENIKQRPKKERLAYFWDYYKWHLLAVVLAVVLLVQGVVTLCTRKEVVFTGYLMNCMINIDDEAFLQGFYDRVGIDPKKQEAAMFNDIMLSEKNTKNDVSAFQRIVAGVSMQEVDILVGQDTPFRICAYAYSNVLLDLRELLDEQTLQQYADRLYYVDGAVRKKLNAPIGEQIDFTVTYPDPTRPDTMEDPIPVGINVTACKEFHDSYYFPEAVIYLGVTSTTPRTQLATEFIDYLFSE